MSDPEEKLKHQRRRSQYAKELEKRQYRQRKKEDAKKKVDVTKLTHHELVKLIQEEDSEC